MARQLSRFSIIDLQCHQCAGAPIADSAVVAELGLSAWPTPRQQLELGYGCCQLGRESVTAAPMDVGHSLLSLGASRCDVFGCANVLDGFYFGALGSAEEDCHALGQLRTIVGAVLSTVARNAFHLLCG